MCIWVHKHVFIRRLTYCKCVSPPRVGSCFASVFANWYDGQFLDPLKSTSCCPCEKKRRVLRGAGSNLQAHHRRLSPGKYTWNADTFEWCSHYKRLNWHDLVCMLVVNSCGIYFRFDWRTRHWCIKQAQNEIKYKKKKEKKTQKRGFFSLEPQPQTYVAYFIHFY